MLLPLPPPGSLTPSASQSYFLSSAFYSPNPLSLPPPPPAPLTAHLRPLLHRKPTAHPPVSQPTHLPPPRHLDHSPLFMRPLESLSLARALLSPSLCMPPATTQPPTPKPLLPLPPPVSLHPLLPGTTGPRRPKEFSRNRPLPRRESRNRRHSYSRHPRFRPWE